MENECAKRGGSNSPLLDVKIRRRRILLASLAERPIHLARFAFALILFLTIGIDAHAAEQPLAASTIVLYNKNVSDSVALATFYAEQRGIAHDHLVGLECSTEEEISREEYDATIANPFRDIFKERQ